MTTHTPDAADAHAVDPREITCYDLPAVTRDLRTVGQRLDDELAALRSENTVLREAIERMADSVTVLMLERELRGVEREQVTA